MDDTDKLIILQQRMKELGLEPVRNASAALKKATKDNPPPRKLFHTKTISVVIKDGDPNTFYVPEEIMVNYGMNPKVALKSINSL